MQVMSFYIERIRYLICIEFYHIKSLLYTIYILRFYTERI